MRVGFLKNRAPTQFVILLSGLCLVAGWRRSIHRRARICPLASDDPPLRLAVSDKVVMGVNINDARAAMAVWSEELLKKIGLK